MRLWRTRTGVVMTATPAALRGPTTTNSARELPPPPSFGAELAMKRVELAMRMRGLEPPRGSQEGGGGWPRVAGSGMVEPFRLRRPHGSAGAVRDVWARNGHRSAASLCQLVTREES